MNSVKSLPYQPTLIGGRLCLDLPIYSKIYHRQGWFWKEVHNGSHWYDQGLIPEQNSIKLSFPADATVRVYAEGKVWDLALPRKKEAFNLSKFISSHQKETRFLIVALSVHLAVTLTALLGSFLGSTSSVNEVNLTQEEPTAVAAQVESPASGGRKIVPFGGIRYSRFLRELILKTGTAAERLSAMVGDFSGLGMGDVKVAADSGTSAIGTIAAPGDQVSQTIRNRKFIPFKKSSEGLEESRLSSKDQELVRNRFQQIQPDLKRAYSRALAKDPKLSVRVAFETEVSPQGALRLKSFRAQGTHTSAGLEELRAAMNDVFSKVQFESRFSGLVVRGENVFVR